MQMQEENASNALWEFHKWMICVKVILLLTLEVELRVSNLYFISFLKNQNQVIGSSS